METQNTPLTLREILDHASQDATFRDQLQANSSEILRQAGLDLPDNVEPNISLDDPRFLTISFSIPLDAPISEEVLEGISGGGDVVEMEGDFSEEDPSLELMRSSGSQGSETVKVYESRTHSSFDRPPGADIVRAARGIGELAKLGSRSGASQSVVGGLIKAIFAGA